MNSDIDPSAASGGHRRPRREPKLGDTRSPVTTVVVLAAAAITVITGFVILGSVTNETDGSDDVVSGGATTSSVAAPETTTSPSLNTSTSTTSTTTTVAPSASKSDAVVVVANASGVGGSATAMIAELAAAGYTMAPVANAHRTTPRAIHHLLPRDRPGCARRRSPPRRPDPVRTDTPDAATAARRPSAQHSHRGADARPRRRRTLARRAADRLSVLVSAGS